MKTLIRSAVAGIAATGLIAVGYGAADADAPKPAAPKPGAAPAQFVPHAGNGASVRPPSRPDSVYVPITSCRIVNTATKGGRIAAGTTRSFYVVGKGTGFAAQGGATDGCRIPAMATAISARLTAFRGSAAGSFGVYATGAPTAHVAIWYPKTSYLATQVTVPLASGSDKVLTVRASGGPADLAIDVEGYYDEQLHGMISPSGAVYSGSNHMVSAEVLGTGYYRVTFDRDVTNCTPTVDTYQGVGVYASAYAFSGTDVFIHTWYLNSTSHLEVPYAYYVYLTVNC